MVTKTQEEIAEMRHQIELGALPPDAIKKYREEEARNVFGHDARKSKGRLLEQGLGSAGNQTRNSIESYRKYGKGDPDYAANLERMERELKESNERRAEEAA